MLATILLEGGIVGHKQCHLLATSAGQHVAQLAGTLGTLDELLGTHVRGRCFDIFDLDLLAGRGQVGIAGSSIAVAALSCQCNRLLFAILIDAACERERQTERKIEERDEI